MYPGEFGGWIILIPLLIWLLILSYIIYRQIRMLDTLFPKSAKNVSEAALLIRQQLNNILDQLEEVKKGEINLKRNFRELVKDGLNHTQKVALLRYNPYGDTGGDQSFSVAILDGKLNGFLLSSLHSRVATRVYTKIINGGKSDLDLSKEEKEVLKKAIEDRR